MPSPLARRPAAGVRRVAALAVDYGVIAVWAGVLAGGAAVLRSVRGGLPDLLGTLGPLRTQLVFFALLDLVVGTYLYRTESGRRSATWGKRVVGLRVVREGGGRPGRWAVLIRVVVKLTPWELAHTFVWQLLWYSDRHGRAATPPWWITAGLIGASASAGIWLLMVLVTGRGPHDRLAATAVVAAEA